MQGCTTQFSGRHPGKKCDIVVGLDFGTSCTKIILRSPYQYGGRAYAVPFAEAAHDSSPHLLPSVLRLNQGHEFVIGNGGEGSLYRDIKLHLVRAKTVPPVDGQGDEIAADVLAVAFLALGLRRARDWFLRKQKKLYDRFRLVWHLNVGLPSADYADENLTKAYRAVSEAAWLLSIANLAVTVQTATTVLRQVRSGRSPGTGDVAVEVVPEVAAEATGYARSQRRNEGLHLLVDVGASTLDICTFILREAKGDDCYEMLTADVQRLGTMALYRGRVDGVHEAVSAHVIDLWSKCDPVKPIPESPEDYLPESKALAQHVVKAGEEYARNCRQTLWRTIIDLKRRRDPNSPRWKDGLPTFLCGGGSAMGLYDDVISRLSSELRRFYAGTAGLDRYALPKPDELEATVDEASYHRLAVAWGLSYPEYEIGSITRPCDIDDVPLPKETVKPEIPWER
ncbi:MAG: hypothetical protein ACLFVW_02455 [Phycisphaerae bacterium]